MTERLTDDGLDRLGILELHVAEERKDFVDDGGFVESIDDAGQAGENVERQLEVASVPLKDDPAENGGRN